MKYYSVIRRNEVLVHATRWMNPPIHAKGGQNPQKFISKKLCIYSYTFKLQSPSKYLPFEAIHLLRCFSTSQNSFWTHQFWCLLVLLPFFCFIHIGRMFPVRSFFHPGKQSHSGWDWINRESGAWGPRHPWSKTAEHSAQCGQVRS